MLNRKPLCQLQNKPPTARENHEQRKCRPKHAAKDLESCFREHFQHDTISVVSITEHTDHYTARPSRLLPSVLFSEICTQRVGN